MQKCTSSHIPSYVWAKEVMDKPEVKFIIRWNDYLEQCREFARAKDGEKIQIAFHICNGTKMNEIVKETDEWIRRGQEKMDKHTVQKPTLI